MPASTYVRRQSTFKYLQSPRFTKSSSGVSEGTIRCWYNWKRTAPSSWTFIRCVSNCEKAWSSIVNSLPGPVPSRPTAFSYTSRIAAKKTRGWKWVPPVKTLDGWGHGGKASPFDDRWTPSEQESLLWLSGDPCGPGYIITWQRVHVAGFL
jgi:hypothetical protein